MEKVFNNPEISDFIGRYSFENWVPIIESLTLYSIRTLLANFKGKDDYPTVSEILSFFKTQEIPVSINSTEFSEIYSHIHRIDKKLRNIAKRSNISKNSAKKSHHRHNSKSKHSLKNQDTNLQNPVNSPSYLLDKAKEKINAGSPIYYTNSNTKPKIKENNNEIYSEIRPGSSLPRKKQRNNAVTDIEISQTTGNHAIRPHTETGFYQTNNHRNLNLPQSTTNNAFRSTREDPPYKIPSSMRAHAPHTALASHTTNSPNRPNNDYQKDLFKARDRLIKERNTEIPSGETRLKKTAYEKVIALANRNLPNKESIRSANEKYETWLSSTNEDKDEKIPTSQFAPIEIDSEKPEIGSRIFNKFTTLISNQKLKHRLDDENSKFEQRMNFSKKDQ